MNLSKSRYTKGVQCPKMLWMLQNMPEQFDDSVMNEAILEQGNIVGDLAMGYYGEFVEVPFDDGDFERMMRQTDELLQAGASVICEATFAYEGCLCQVDILRVQPEGGVHVVEVKSSTHLKDIHLHDVAYQVWVLRMCGLDVKSASLMCLNSGYVRQGEVDLQELFVVHDITGDVMSMQEEVASNTAFFRQFARQAEEPRIEVGDQCKNPCPCGFKSWCWRDMPQPSVFDINNLRAAKRESVINTAGCDFDAVVRSGVKLSRRQELQVRAEVEDIDEFFDAAEVRAWLATLRAPLYFLDFETYQQAVPPFDGMRPYEQIPTQYSLHVVDAIGKPGEVHDDGEGAGGPIKSALHMEHLEFLAKAGADPRRSIAEALCQDIPKGACVVAYNMGFEKSVLSRLAGRFDDLTEHLLSIAAGCQDLIVPFKSGAYYVRQMGGSNSIKAVLPALFPDDSELDYHALEGVHMGTEASQAFLALSGLDEREAANVRGQLLAYCRLDTLAMVRIWERLREKADY